MSCWKGGGVSRWNAPPLRAAGTWWQPSRTSGNRAFDDYREETLRRLEEEQREFREFLERLRMAKDKSEFDQFMAERRTRTSPSTSSQDSSSRTPRRKAPRFGLSARLELAQFGGPRSSRFGGPPSELVLAYAPTAPPMVGAPQLGVRS